LIHRFTGIYFCKTKREKRIVQTMMTSQKVIIAPMDGRTNQLLATQAI